MNSTLGGAFRLIRRRFGRDGWPAISCPTLEARFSKRRAVGKGDDLAMSPERMELMLDGVGKGSHETD